MTDILAIVTEHADGSVAEEYAPCPELPWLAPMMASAPLLLPTEANGMAIECGGIRVDVTREAGAVRAVARRNPTAPDRVGDGVTDWKAECDRLRAELADTESQVELLAVAARAVLGVDDDDHDALAKGLIESVAGLRAREVAEADAWAAAQRAKDLAAERDAAVARSEQAERERDELRKIAIGKVARSHALTGHSLMVEASELADLRRRLATSEAAIDSAMEQVGAIMPEQCELERRLAAETARAEQAERLLERERKAALDTAANYQRRCEQAERRCRVLAATILRIAGGYEADPVTFASAMADMLDLRGEFHQQSEMAAMPAEGEGE